MELVSGPQGFALEAQVQNLLSDGGQLFLFGLKIGVPVATGQFYLGLMFLELFDTAVQPPVLLGLLAAENPKNSDLQGTWGDDLLPGNLHNKLKKASRNRPGPVACPNIGQTVMNFRDDRPQAPVWGQPKEEIMELNSSVRPSRRTDPSLTAWGRLVSPLTTETQT